MKNSTPRGSALKQGFYNAIMKLYKNITYRGVVNMAVYHCPECEAEMNLLWEENKVICPNCGCWEEISDEEMEDFDGESSMSYCNVCEHSDEYPECKDRCPYDD